MAPSGVSAVLYRRDEGISRDYAPQSRFCHDMAFYLFTRDTVRPTGTGGAQPAELVSFRTDIESTRDQASLPAANLDVSLLGNHMTNAESLLEIVDRYDSITTDRLHVAIAGLLRGKKVTLHPCSYPKISGIYEASLAKIPGVDLRFVAAPPDHR